MEGVEPDTPTQLHMDEFLSAVPPRYTQNHTCQTHFQVPGTAVRSRCTHVTKSFFVCRSAVSLSPLSFWFLFYFISRLLFSRSSLLFFYKSKDPELIF